MELSYYVLDVFTSVPLQGGNPHAVFPDATELDTGMMQRIARELNLPETSFIIPQESNDRRTRVRIFTPDAELPFAGVPTIGAAYVMRAAGIVPRSSKNFVLQENVGDVAVRVDEGEDPVVWLTTPPIEKLGEYPRERCAAMVGLQPDQLVAGVPCELLTAGNAFIFIAVDRPTTVDQARLDLAIFEEIVKDRSTPTQVFVFAATDAGAYSRMFGPQIGVPEDPATGSATGPLALFMMKYGLAPSADGTRFVSEQGTQMGRQSFVHVHVHGERGDRGIDVGGHIAELAKGVMTVPAHGSVAAVSKTIKTPIHSTNAPRPLGPYSQAIEIGGQVFFSGQIAVDFVTGEVDGDDIEAQVRKTLTNLGAVVEAAGMTYDDIVKTTIFLTQIEEYFEKFNAVYSTFFPNTPPARTTVAVKALPRGSMVMIDAVGIRNAAPRSH